MRFKKKIFLSFGSFDERNKFELLDVASEKQRKFGSFHVSRLENRGVRSECERKKKGKEKEEKYRARASVYGHATVVQRDAYVRTPFINNAVVH